jgi:hypothetical protein
MTTQKKSTSEQEKNQEGIYIQRLTLNRDKSTLVEIIRLRCEDWIWSWIDSELKTSSEAEDGIWSRRQVLKKRCVP